MLVSCQEIFFLAKALSRNNLYSVTRQARGPHRGFGGLALLVVLPIDQDRISRGIAAVMSI